MAYKVDAAYVRDTVLAPLIGRGARYENAVTLTTIEEFVAEAKLATEQRLSTRFTPTEFSGWDGKGSRPSPTAADPTAVPAVLPAEVEPAYMWPAISPGLGFLNFRLRMRPILEFYGGTLRLPGAPAPGVDLLPDWFRVESYTSELTLMPNFGGAALVMPNLPFGLFNWMKQRIPDGVLFKYRAGMDDQEWNRFPQVNRLVALRAAIACLPTLALRINPTQVTSKSADGLSLSRASGYVFKDFEERLDKEAEAVQTQILDAWEGSSALSIL
jgi:hypothetical protein